jgi:tape measure domain-containing protein
MLLTYGVEAEKVSKIVEQLSEVSAGSGERFQRISYAFGQISSMGRLMGTELRQLTEAGFNPLEMISKKTGESMEKLKGRMEDGKISVLEVRDALTAATSEGGRFFGMNEKMSQTFSGRVSMMKDQWNIFTGAFGDGMNRGLKDVADAITNGLPTIMERFRKMGDLLGNAISDAVMGNYDKFVAAGKLIGDVMGAAATAAFQAASSGIIESTENALRGGIRAGASAVGVENPEKYLPNMGGNSFQDLFEAHLILRDISSQIKSVASGVQGLVPGTGGQFRFARENESTSLRDASGNRVVEVLNQIERNTSGGAKM